MYEKKLSLFAHVAKWRRSLDMVIHYSYFFDSFFYDIFKIRNTKLIFLKTLFYKYTKKEEE